MSSLSFQTSTTSTSHAKVAKFAIHALAILSVLLLAAVVEVAAQIYFDPQGEIIASQMFVAP